MAPGTISGRPRGLEYGFRFVGYINESDSISSTLPPSTAASFACCCAMASTARSRSFTETLTGLTCWTSRSSAFFRASKDTGVLGNVVVDAGAKQDAVAMQLNANAHLKAVDAEKLWTRGRRREVIGRVYTSGS